MIQKGENPGGNRGSQMGASGVTTSAINGTAAVAVIEQISPYERLTAALEAHGCDYRESEKTWLCPVHGGHALKVDDRDGNALVFCHSPGCKGDDVVRAVGLKMSDLSWPREQDAEKPGPVPDWAARELPGINAPGEHVFLYTDKDGTPLYAAVRTQHDDGSKSFVQKGPEGVPSVKGIRPVLYRLPAVMGAIEAGHTIHLSEGEKAALALVASGEVATCNSAGCGQWQDELADSLKGAAEVVVWQDRDDSGAKWAAAVSMSLLKRGIPHRTVQSRTEGAKDDAWDHLAAGWSADQAVPVAKPADPVDSLLGELLDSAGLDDIPSPEPLIEGWLTLDTLARVNGEPGAGKSFIALDWAAHVGTGTDWNGHTTRQGEVFYIVAEGVRGLRKRVRAWERHHRKKMTNVHFLPRPVQVLSDDREWFAFIEACRRRRPALVILDTQSRVTVGVEENSNTDMGQVVHNLEKLRAATGACVLLAHHTPKNTDGGRGASVVTGALNSEFMVKKRRNGQTRVDLENTKEKDAADGTKLTFVMHTVELDRAPDDDPWSLEPPETSVVLVLEDREERPGEDDSAEVDVTLPPGTAALEKLRILLRRVWGNGGAFTKAEARSLVVTHAKAVALPTFHAKWRDLVAEGFVIAERSESGKELSRYRLEAASHD